MPNSNLIIRHVRRRPPIYQPSLLPPLLPIASLSSSCLSTWQLRSRKRSTTGLPWLTKMASGDKMVFSFEYTCARLSTHQHAPRSSAASSCAGRQASRCTWRALRPPHTRPPQTRRPTPTSSSWSTRTLASQRQADLRSGAAHAESNRAPISDASLLSEFAARCSFLRVPLPTSGAELPMERGQGRPACLRLSSHPLMLHGSRC